MIEIIVIKYNTPVYERECITSILETTDVPYHLTVYDNYVKDEGLAKVWNRLIGHSNADVIVLVNSDTILEQGWTKMLNGISCPTGPITNRCGTSQTGFSKADKRNKKREVSQLSGFFLAFPRIVWEQVRFNEAYKLYGEDSEWCDRVRSLGHKLIVDHSVHIYHHGGGSGANQPKKDEYKQKAREIYGAFKSGVRQAT